MKKRFTWSGLAERAKGWMKNLTVMALGMTIRDNAVYIALLERSASGRISKLWQDVLPAPEGTDREELWEMACSRARQNIEGDAVCCLVLDETEVFFYEKNFPDMEEKELKQAIKLDFAAASAWQEKFVWSYQGLASGGYRVAGIRQRALQERLSVIKQFFPLAAGVLLRREADESVEEPESLAGLAREGLLQEEHYAGMRGAVYAALACLRDEGIVFSAYSRYIPQWNWAHLTQALWGAALLIALVGGSLCWQHLQQAEDQVYQAESQLELLSDVSQRQEAIRADQQSIERKNKLLAGLQQEGSSRYGTLARLGGYTEQGLWLTAVNVSEEGGMLLEGKAAAYSRLSGLLSRLEQYTEAKDPVRTGKKLDRAAASADVEPLEDQEGGNELFANNNAGVALAKSDVGADGLIDFQIKGRG